MKKKLRQLFLHAAIRIGDELLAKAETAPLGLSWECVNQQPDKITWHKSESIYNGVGGIVLFLAELYKQSRQEKYRHAALEGGRWLEWYCRQHPAASQAFLTGRMSVPYTYLQLYRLCRQPDFLEKALSLAQTCLADPDLNLMEYINGAAGIILCLVHLHAASQQAWLLPYIDSYTGLLISQAHIGQKGLYWDRSPLNIRGLCGFSHGASGIGYVLLELGHYFQNPSFNWLAGQAFGYESQFYDPALNNWFDFRKMILTQQDEAAHRQAYESGDADFFTQGASMNAWCHGAAGIGLSRLRAYELLQKPEYAAEARQAIAHTQACSLKADRMASFTLCHGGGGNAELFLKAYGLFDDPAYLAMAVAVAKEALQSREAYRYYLSGTKYPGEDTSLFMGNAGIGYFYLRLLKPRQVPSVLLPEIRHKARTDVSAYPNLSLSVGAMQHRLTGKVFSRTLQLLEKLLPGEVENYFGPRSITPVAPLPEDFVPWVQARMALLPAPESQLLEEVMLTEYLKLQMNVHITSDALLSFKNNRKKQRAALLEAMPDSVLLEVVLAADPDMHLIRTQWPCHRNGPAAWLAGMTAQAGDYALLLMPSPDYTGEQELSDFTATVLAAFSQKKTVAAGIADILSHFEDFPPTRIAEVQQLILAQIRQAIRSGMLLEPDQHPLPVIARPAFAPPASMAATSCFTSSF